MKPFIRTFMPDFRPMRGESFDFDMLDFNAIQKLPYRSGVYVIVSKKKPYFIYPNGKSPIIYIGQSSKLKQRLTDHYKALVEVCKPESENLWYSSRYQFMRHFGAHVYIFYCLKNQDPKDLESRFLWSFYYKFHSIPFGNGARSFQNS